MNYNEIITIFNSLKKNQKNVANTTSRERISKLKKLLKAVIHYKEEIREALYKDFRKIPQK